MKLIHGSALQTNNHTNFTVPAVQIHLSHTVSANNPKDSTARFVGNPKGVVKKLDELLVFPNCTKSYQGPLTT